MNEVLFTHTNCFCLRGSVYFLDIQISSNVLKVQLLPPPPQAFGREQRRARSASDWCEAQGTAGRRKKRGACFLLPVFLFCANLLRLRDVWVRARFSG